VRLRVDPGLKALRSPTGDHPHIKHRSMDMTLRYAKIANRTVADEYFAVTDCCPTL
jgi:hypothetical protein